MKKYLPIRFKNWFSFLLDWKAFLTIVVLLVLTLTLLIASISLGDMRIPPLDVMRVLFGGGEETQQLVITSFRLPRIIIAMLVGMCLAAAGAILQGIIRNPLASPDIIGITGGAGVAVVTFLAVFSNENNALTVSIHWLPLAAFIGATLVAFLVYGLAWKNGVSPVRLVLIGIGISTLAQALTTLLMIVGPIYRASQANIWLTGTVYGSTWDDVTILTPWALVLLTATFLLSRNLNLQELGDEMAKGLGSRVQVQRVGLLFVSTALTGGAVAFAGGIGFVGLMSPHIARNLVGSAFGALIPVSAFIGAMLVLAADLVGRTVFSPLEVPAGVFTALIGAPYFIYLLFKNRNL
ncbi:FecCD family ABC transporter permease [Salibacterium aidingense]|uniref:FecCD family ABC transporter permease n=1 Tax=Salibacterium aidingense TaxID=384933 RepID=UPI00042459F4|nr:iron ABC transporter permease [Salibacterium aidingense]